MNNKNKLAIATLARQSQLISAVSGGVAATDIILKEDDNGFWIKIKTPSLNEEHYTIDLVNHQLNIYTVLPEGSNGEDENFAFVPSFFRSFPLPPFADTQNIEAEFHESKGELSIFVPFGHKENPIKRINIKN